MHYHTIENTPGYLPDNDDPGTFEDRASAEAYAQELADQYADDDVIAYTIEGNARDGFYIADPTRTHDLGRVIEVSECSQSECEVSG